MPRIRDILIVGAGVGAALSLSCATPKTTATDPIPMPLADGDSEAPSIEPQGTVGRTEMELMNRLGAHYSGIIIINDEPFEVPEGFVGKWTAPGNGHPAYIGPLPLNGYMRHAVMIDGWDEVVIYPRDTQKIDTSRDLSWITPYLDAQQILQWDDGLIVPIDPTPEPE